jgi:hypothetical protein
VGALSRFDAAAHKKLITRRRAALMVSQSRNSTRTNRLSVICLRKCGGHCRFIGDRGNRQRARPRDRQRRVLPIDQLGSRPGSPGSLVRRLLSHAREEQRGKLGFAAHECSGPPALPARLGMSFEKLKQSRANGVKQASTKHATCVAVQLSQVQWQLRSNVLRARYLLWSRAQLGCLELASQCGLVDHHLNACRSVSVRIQVVLGEPLTLRASLLVLTVWQ